MVVNLNPYDPFVAIQDRLSLSGISGIFCVGRQRTNVLENAYSVLLEFKQPLPIMADYVCLKKKGGDRDGGSQRCRKSTTDHRREVGS